MEVNDTLTNFSSGTSTERLDIAIDLRTAIPLGIIACVLFLSTGVGNLFVIAAVVRDPKLRSLASKLIASLASTGTLVGFIVLPLAAISGVLGYWPFPKTICNFFTFMDVLLCTNSILHMVVIALDKYWTATDPAYRPGSRKYDALFPIAVSLTWILSIAVCLPPLFGWSKKESDNGRMCVISQDHGYTVYSTMTAFYLPLTFIIIIYTKVFFVIRARVRRKTFKNQIRQYTSAQLETEGKDLLNKPPTQQKPCVPEDESQESTDLSMESCGGPKEAESQTCIDVHVQLVSENKTQVQAKTTKSHRLGRRKNTSSSNPDRLAQKREWRARRTLLTITGVFIGCWLPFFIYALVTPFCGQWCSDNVPKYVGSVVTWLGYSNSAFNPVIYTIFSPDFRKAFKNILSCKR